MVNMAFLSGETSRYANLLSLDFVLVGRFTTREPFIKFGRLIAPAIKEFI